MDYARAGHVFGSGDWIINMADEGICLEREILKTCNSREEARKLESKLLACFYYHPFCTNLSGRKSICGVLSVKSFRRKNGLTGKIILPPDADRVRSWLRSTQAIGSEVTLQDIYS
jgi:hypothetical protein